MNGWDQWTPCLIFFFLKHFYIHFVANKCLVGNCFSFAGKRIQVMHYFIQIISYNIKTSAVLTDRAMATSIFHLEDGYINTNSYNNKCFKRLPLVLVFSIVNWNSKRKEKGNTVELALKIRTHLSSFYIQITKEITFIYCVYIKVNFFYLSIAIFTEYMYLVCQISWFIYPREISSQKSNVLHIKRIPS